MLYSIFDIFISTSLFKTRNAARTVYKEVFLYSPSLSKLLTRGIYLSYPIGIPKI